MINFWECEDLRKLEARHEAKVAAMHAAIEDRNTTEGIKPVSYYYSAEVRAKHAEAERRVAEALAYRQELRNGLEVDERITAMVNGA